MNKQQFENVDRKDLVRMDAKEKAKRIRIILVREFPQTKFTVRKVTASMLVGVEITWIDGPTDEQVRAYTNVYDGTDFSGEFDSFNYVSTTRRESPESYEWAKKQVEMITGEKYPDDYRNPELAWYVVWGKTDLTGVF